MTSSSYQSGMLFTQAHRLVRQRIAIALAKHNLSMMQWSILSIVATSQDGIRLSSVAELLGVKAPLITLEATRLISSGLITRLPHYTDKRAKLLLITQPGKKLLGTTEQELSKQIELLTSGLSSSELATFEKSLITIIRNA